MELLCGCTSACSVVFSWQVKAIGEAMSASAALMSAEREEHEGFVRQAKERETDVEVDDCPLGWSVWVRITCWMNMTSSFIPCLVHDHSCHRFCTGVFFPTPSMNRVNFIIAVNDCLPYHPHPTSVP